MIPTNMTELAFEGSRSDEFTNRVRSRFGRPWGQSR